jgi:hypothetical protein
MKGSGHPRNKIVPNTREKLVHTLQLSGPGRNYNDGAAFEVGRVARPRPHEEWFQAGAAASEPFRPFGPPTLSGTPRDRGVHESRRKPKFLTNKTASILKNNGDRSNCNL